MLLEPPGIIDLDFLDFVDFLTGNEVELLYSATALGLDSLEDSTLIFYFSPSRISTFGSYFHP